MKPVTDADSRKRGSDEGRSPIAVAFGWRPLSNALRDFAVAWGRVRYPSSGGSREREAAIGLLLCAVIVGVGYFCDAAEAHWATGLPVTLEKVFGHVTLLGKSGYIFVLCVAVAVIAVRAGERGTDLRFKAAMNGLAGRATFVFAVNAVSGILSQVLKHLVGRARPKLIAVDGPFHFDLFSIKATFASFPSGHTVTVFATAMALSYFAPRLRLWLFLVAALVAFSRLAIGAHYPSDVLAGALLGIGTAIYLRRAFAARGLVFRRAGDRIRARKTGSMAAALGVLASRGHR